MSFPAICSVISPGDASTRSEYHFSPPHPKGRDRGLIRRGRTPADAYGMVTARARTTSKSRTLPLVAALLTALLLSACTPEQNEAYGYVNDSRAAHTLAGLGWHGDLGAKAQAHAEQMAQRGTIYHSSLTSDIPSTVCWRSLGENVGVGGSIKQVHDAYMRSPGHKANILKGVYTHVGTGVAKGKDGRVYTVHVFLQGC